MPETTTETKAKHYQREQLTLGLIEEIATLFFLIVWVWISPHVVSMLTGLRRFGLLLLYAAIIYATYQIMFFVLDYLSGYRLEHKYDLSTENFPKWLWRHFKAIALGGLLLGAIIVGLYAAVWYLKYWYLWSWLAWVLLSIVIAQLFPIIILPIFYPAKRLENPALLDRFRQLSAGTGITIEGVYNLALSQSTKKGNAMLAGLGRTRRVLLGDTLLERLTEPQIEVVYAHELGHHVYRHHMKGLTLHALSSIILLGLIYLVLAPCAGRADLSTVAIERLPLLTLAMSLFTFFWRPLLYAFSRYFERQADDYALARTNSPESFITAFEALAEQNLEDPVPPSWVVFLYYDHPPIHKRIETARRLLIDGK